MYKGQADWTLILEVRRNPRICIPIFGNGDIDSVEKAAAWRMEYEVDGIMIGRAAIGNPWIFREISHYFKTGEHLDGPTLNERVEACRTHLLKSIEARKSVVSGKNVSIRVDHGGGRIIKKKTQN